MKQEGFGILKILQKLGLKYENLTSEERESFAEYEKILNVQDITMEDVKKLITAEKERLNQMLLNYDNDEKKELWTKACLRNIMMLEVYIFSTVQRRQQAVNELKQRFQL